MEKKIEDGFKPRTWLLVILIIIALCITVFLINGYVNYRKEVKSKRESILEKINKKAEQKQEEMENEAKKAEEEINKKRNEYEVSSFNDYYEMYAGSQMGSSVIWMLDNLITNNKTNKERILTVKYNDTETQDEESIRTIKNSLDKFKNYEVILDYNEEGFVNKVTIR